MYVVAITGGIGSGKTTIADQFAALGIDLATGMTTNGGNDQKVFSVRSK